MRDSSEPRSSADEPDEPPTPPTEQAGLAAAVARSRAIGLDGGFGRPQEPTDASAFWRAPSTHVPEAPEDEGERAARGEREGDRDARAAIIANAPVLDSITVQAPEPLVLSAPAESEQDGAPRPAPDAAQTGPVPPLPDHIRVPEGVTLPPGVRLPQGVTVFDGSLYSGSPLLEPEPVEERAAQEPAARGPEPRGAGRQGPESQDPELQGPEPRGPESRGPELQGPESQGPEVQGPEPGHAPEPRAEEAIGGAAPPGGKPQGVAPQVGAPGEPGEEPATSRASAAEAPVTAASEAAAVEAGSEPPERAGDTAELPDLTPAPAFARRTIEVDAHDGAEDPTEVVELLGPAAVAEDEPPPPAPRPRVRNAGFAFAVAVFGTLVYALLSLLLFGLLRALLEPQGDPLAAAVGFARTAPFWLSVAGFGLLFALWGLAVNRLRRGGFLLGGLLAAATVFLLFHLGATLQAFGPGPAVFDEPFALLGDPAQLPGALVCAIAAREAFSWCGALIPLRARALRRRVRAAQRPA